MAGGIGAALTPALLQLCSELTAAGVAADLRPGRVQVPGAWVTARTAARRTMRAATFRAQVHLVVADSEADVALYELGRLLDLALEVVAPAEAINTAHAVTLPHTPTPLPAFLLTTDLLVPTS